MKTGAEPKKLAILGVLALVAVIVLYENVFSGSDSPAPVTAPAPTAVATPVPSAAAATPNPRRRATTSTASLGEFKVRQGAARPEDRPDPASINPTLRLDLLAKIQNVEPEEATRNLFQYGAAAPVAKPVVLPVNTPKIVINNRPAGPPPVTLPPPVPSVITAPPMTFKYYGYKVVKSSGRKQAFLLDGDEIIIAGENDQVKTNRFKVVRIGVNSITIEDTQYKATQTLPLQEEAIG